MPENEGSNSPSVEDLAKQLDELKSQLSAKDTELDTWKTNSRKHETRARENADAAKRLADLENNKLSDQEKAIKTALSEAESKWRSEMGQKLTFTELKSKAVAKLGEDKFGKIANGLNVNAFMDDEGNPNSQAIDDFLDGLAPAESNSSNQNVFDFGQGAQGQATSLATDDLTKQVLGMVGFKV